jgi:6-pyruvoyltetrahydropterin/6-carboxytetrahydropterin synthase
MHGHNYQIEIEIGSEKLNEKGMLIDFADLKKILADTLGVYDHMHLGVIPDGWSSNTNHVIPLPFNLTTAENLAKHWGQEVQEKIKPLKLVKICVYESSSSKASWIPDD